jgi:beta-galactosidase
MITLKAIHRILAAALLFVAIPSMGVEGPASGSSRVVRDFNNDWRFFKGEPANPMAPDFDDNNWRLLKLPHDWSSEGPFSGDLGSGNGFAPGGIGWYRKEIRLDASMSNKIVTVEFDGIYSHAQVWINGHYIGGRPNGYMGFELELTPLLKFGGRKNVLAVRVDHTRITDSRWYTGSGIYRNVRLRITDKLRIGQWGVFVTTPQVSADAALVRVETTVENSTGESRSFGLQSDILDARGQIIGTALTSGTTAHGTNSVVLQDIRVTKPGLWSPGSPVLYNLKSTLMRSPVAIDNSTVPIVDESVTTFGIRSLQFDANKGFSINGIPMKFKGICIHHDAGTLGAAVPTKVWERRLRILKDMGVNAIRTSHNPPAPELLDLCDRLGLLVKDEAFDEFTPGKNKWMAGWNSGQPSRYGYSEVFKDWSVTDARDMVRRDRNHPSVIMWSIGNEIDYPNDPFTHPILGNEYRPENPSAENLVLHAKPLIAAIKQVDTTRPVTMAFARAEMSDAVGLGELLDIVGYNYQEARYTNDHAKYPKRFIFGSETRHAYDGWAVVRDNEYVGGQFLWTGIDYLGEASRWPNRGSSAGILDLCGFKKPNAWFRESLWTEKPMVYLCASPAGGGGGGGGGGRGRGGVQEHWNWASNATVNVRCYTSCQEVELVLNNRSLGKRNASEAVQGVLIWQVPFESGTLKAVGLKSGQPTCEFVLRTAGDAKRVELVEDTKSLASDGYDISHLEFQVVDENGVRVPNATNLVTFAVDGPATLLGIENGDLNSPDTGKNGSRNVFRGRGLAILQSKNQAGAIKVRATAEGLQPAEVSMESR